MNVLVLAPHSFYIDRGTPIDVDILVRAITNRGDSVDLVVYGEGEDRDYPHLTIHRAYTPKWLKEIGPGFSIKKLIADFFLFFAARSVINTRPIDIVHAGEESVFMALWFKFWKKTPYIYDMDSSIAQQMVEKMPILKPVSFVFNWFEAKAIKEAEATSPVCNALSDLARRRGAKHITTLHDISQLNIENTPQSSRDIRQELGIKADDVILMYVGNLETYQGIDLLLESIPYIAKAHSQVKVVIAGGSPDHIKKYQSKSEELNVSQITHFIGPWPASKLAELILQADILTAPRTKGLNTPMKVFPYLHSGVAVVVTDLPTHSQILEPTFCVLAPAEPSGFAHSISQLVDQPEYRKRLGQAGRVFAQTNHTFPAHQKRVNELYDYIEERVNAR